MDLKGLVLDAVDEIECGVFFGSLRLLEKGTVSRSRSLPRSKAINKKDEGRIADIPEAFRSREVESR